jgi:hypothetical protein
MKLSRGIPQFFFDDTQIAHHRRLVRRWLPAKVFPHPVIVPDRPWEGRNLTLFGTVLPDPGGGYRMYYTDWPAGQGGHRYLLLAMSSDGLRWEKPNLGVVEWAGKKDNNIVLAFTRAADSPSLIYDADDTQEPYKLIVFESATGAKPGGEWGLFAYTSRDGLQWTPLPGVRLAAGDRTNLMPTKPDVEFYGMSAFERHGWRLGLLEHWRCSTDVLETHLVFSRDGRAWSRPQPRAPFIDPTYEWNRAWSGCASNGPIILKEMMAFYFGARWTSHSYDSVQQYSTIGCASLPLDRFCALESVTGGQFDTVPIEWPGGELVLNADTRSSYESHAAYCDGQIAVEMLDAEGNPLPEWNGEKRAVFRGNTHSRTRIHDGTVRWPGERKMDVLQGRTIRLRFHLDHARLFTFTAVPVA